MIPSCAETLGFAPESSIQSMNSKEVGISEWTVCLANFSNIGKSWTRKNVDA